MDSRICRGAIVEAYTGALTHRFPELCGHFRPPALTKARPRRPNEGRCLDTVHACPTGSVSNVPVNGDRDDVKESGRR